MDNELETLDIVKIINNDFDEIETESIYEDYYTLGIENISEGSNIEYYKYVRSHINNVKKGYRWLKRNLPELFARRNKLKIGLTVARHDKSKLSPNAEFKPYRDHFYGQNIKDKEAEKNNFAKAWNHHQKTNKHHWQYWVLVKGDGTYKTLDMPYENIIEMICDWWSFSWKDNNLYKIFEWYNRNKSSMILSGYTRNTVEGILRKMKNKLDELKKSETKENVSESVLDPIRKTRCQDIFDDVNSESPKLKKSVSEMIISIAEKFIKDIKAIDPEIKPEPKIIELFVVGSSLGLQYRDDSDIDVDMRINLTKKQMSGKFSYIPKNIILPNTNHPINIFLLTADDPEYNFDKDAENAYNVLTDTWIKQSQLSNSNQIPYAYISGISEFIMDGMTLQLQRAERDLRELNKYIKIDPNTVAITEKEKDDAISKKITDLIIDKDALNLAHRIMFKIDQDAFKDDDISISIDYKHETRHYSMNNLIYKYIDSFKFYDKINELVKAIDENIKLAKKEINRNSASETPEGQNKEEVQKEIIENEKDTNDIVKEEYSDEDLKNILIENKYEPTERNIDIIKRGLNEKYFIIDTSDYLSLSESVASRTETYVNKRIFKSVKKWPVGLSSVLGFLFAGVAGMFIAMSLSLFHNRNLDDDEAELYNAVKYDSECSELISKIKTEVNKTKPDKTVLKSLKKQYAAAVKNVANNMKKDKEKYNSAPYISLRKDED